MTRNGTLPCELVDSSDFLIDCPFKFEWVESFKEIRESLFGFFFDMFGFQDSLVRCFGFIVAFDSFGSDAFFGQVFTIKLDASRKTLFARIRKKKKRARGCRWFYGVEYRNKYEFV